MAQGEQLLAREASHHPTTSRGERTRQRLLDAARPVFERDGYHATRVADIADGAGVAHGTFYKYFRSKDDVFRELTNQVVSAMFERTRSPGPVGDPVTRITLANWRYLDAYREDAAFLATVWQAVMSDPAYGEYWVGVRQRWADTIERWVEREVRSGGADRRLDPRVAARALGLMMESFAHHWFVLGERYDEATALATLTQLWLNALGLDAASSADVAAAASRVVASARRG